MFDSSYLSTSPSRCAVMKKVEARIDMVATRSGQMEKAKDKVRELFKRDMDVEVVIHVELW